MRPGRSSFSAEGAWLVIDISMHISLHPFSHSVTLSSSFPLSSQPFLVFYSSLSNYPRADEAEYLLARGSNKREKRAPRVGRDDDERPEKNERGERTRHPRGDSLTPVARLLWRLRDRGRYVHLLNDPAQPSYLFDHRE